MLYKCSAFVLALAEGAVSSDLGTRSHYTSSQSIEVHLPPFDELDKEHTGHISEDVFNNWWKEASDYAFKSGDADGDSVLTQAEYAKIGRQVELFGTTSSRFWQAFVNSVAMILATEIGDKTFFIAAILAMRQPQGVVFLGAICALIIMTVLSVAIGFSLPSLLPRQYTHMCATALFFYFGAKLLYEARQMMVSGEGLGPSDELSEVEQQLVEQGLVGIKSEEEVEMTSQNSEDGLEAACSKSIKSIQISFEEQGMLTIFFQVFVLTFLAEWGDRSQIATIAMASDKEPIGVTLGGVVGHSMCTGVACIGGRYLAAKINERTVILVGGILFLLFGLHSLVTGADS